MAAVVRATVTPAVRARKGQAACLEVSRPQAAAVAEARPLAVVLVDQAAAAAATHPRLAAVGLRVRETTEALALVGVQTDHPAAGAALVLLAPLVLARQVSSVALAVAVRHRVFLVRQSPTPAAAAAVPCSELAVLLAAAAVGLERQTFQPLALMGILALRILAEAAVGVAATRVSEVAAVRAW